MPSNVPLVALYLPLLQHAGVSEAGLLALAAGSTIAGNLLILGAASTVIIVESADRRGTHLRFFGFARVGLPLTALNVAVYSLFPGRLRPADIAPTLASRPVSARAVSPSLRLGPRSGAASAWRA